MGKSGGGSMGDGGAEKTTGYLRGIHSQHLAGFMRSIASYRGFSFVKDITANDDSVRIPYPAIADPDELSDTGQMVRTKTFGNPFLESDYGDGAELVYDPTYELDIVNDRSGMTKQMYNALLADLHDGVAKPADLRDIITGYRDALTELSSEFVGSMGNASDKMLTETSGLLDSAKQDIIDAIADMQTALGELDTQYDEVQRIISDIGSLEKFGYSDLQSLMSDTDTATASLQADLESQIADAKAQMEMSTELLDSTVSELRNAINSVDIIGTLTPEIENLSDVDADIQDIRDIATSNDTAIMGVRTKIDEFESGLREQIDILKSVYDDETTELLTLVDTISSRVDGDTSEMKAKVDTLLTEVRIKGDEYLSTIASELSTSISDFNTGIDALDIGLVDTMVQEYNSSSLDTIVAKAVELAETELDETYIQDQIDTFAANAEIPYNKVLGDYDANMGVLGAIHTSAFQIGRGRISAQHTRSIDQYSADLRAKAMEMRFQAIQNLITTALNRLGAVSNMLNTAYSTELQGVIAAFQSKLSYCQTLATTHLEYINGVLNSSVASTIQEYNTMISLYLTGYKEQVGAKLSVLQTQADIAIKAVNAFVMGGGFVIDGTLKSIEVETNTKIQSLSNAANLELQKITTAINAYSGMYKTWLEAQIQAKLNLAISGVEGYNKNALGLLQTAKTEVDSIMQYLHGKIQAVSGIITTTMNTQLQGYKTHLDAILNSYTTKVDADITGNKAIVDASVNGNIGIVNANTALYNGYIDAKLKTAETQNKLISQKFQAEFDGSIKAAAVIAQMQTDILSQVVETVKMSMLAKRMLKEDEMEKNYKAIMFPLDLYQEASDIIASFHGSPSMARQQRQKFNKTQSTISGAMAGAQMGAQAGGMAGGWGAAIGGLIGAAGGGYMGSQQG